MRLQKSLPSRLPSARSMALACLAAILWLPAPTAAAPASEGEKQKSPVIAKVKGDQVRIDESRLRRKLEDGREIKRFRISRRAGGYELLRVSEIDGRRFTEAIPLELGADGQSLSVIGPVKFEPLKWMTTCSAGDCGGFCIPDGDHCDCFGPGDDERSAADIFDVEEEHAGSLEPGVTGDCTWGSAGGGLWDVIIIR